MSELAAIGTDMVKQQSLVKVENNKRIDKESKCLADLMPAFCERT